MVTLRLPTYVRRDEALRGRRGRFLAIFVAGLKWELRRPLNIIALFLAVAFGVVTTIFNIFLAPLINPGQELTAAVFYGTVTSPVVLFLILIVGTSVGAGLISDDIRHMSLTLYLSRPISPRDYLLSKGSVVAFALVLAVAFPGILGPIVAGVLRYVSWTVALHALGAGLALGALSVALFAFLVLLFSSLTMRKGVAAAGTFASVLILEGLSGSLRDIFEVEAIRHLSLYENVLAVGAPLYGAEGTGLSWGVALVILAVVTAGSALLAYLRIRSMEVVAA